PKRLMRGQRLVRRGGRRGLGVVPAGFAQEPVEDEGERDSGDAEDIESNAPPVPLGKPRSRPASPNRSNIYSRLVKREGQGAGPAAVVAAQERQGGGEVEGLADAGQRAHADELPDPPAEAVRRRREAPEHAAPEYQPLSPDPVPDESGERRAKRVDPCEGRAHEAELNRA